MKKNYSIKFIVEIFDKMTAPNQLPTIYLHMW